MLKTEIKIPTYWIYLILFIAATAFFWGLYFWIDEQKNAKTSALIAGFASAFLVASFQLIITITDALKLSKFVSTGFKEILLTRKDSKYYAALIRNTNEKLLMIGVTASRFMDDFADHESSEGDIPALIYALNKNVHVKILLPKLYWLDTPKHPDFRNKTLPRYLNLIENFPDQIEIRYYDHIPAHSLVVTDTVAIVGPIFRHKESKNTQSLVLEASSGYAKQYIDHFDKEWEDASEKFE